MALIQKAAIVSSLILCLALKFNNCEQIPIGTFFSMWDADYKDEFTAMQYALERQHNDSERMFQFKLFADNIKTADAYKLTRIICRQFERGIFALMGTVDPESFDTLHSYANAFEMPFVTPWFPESVYQGPKDSKQNFAIQIRPEYHEGLIEIITYYEWQKIIYIYNDFDGLLRLQRIYNNIPKNSRGEFQFQIERVKKISSSADAIDFLLSLEKMDRNAVKHVLLDCPTAMAKEIVLKHVQSVYLGRRNFHYLMSGLVLDDHWDREVAEFGAINMTGLRIVRPESEYVSDFMKQWRQLDRLKYPSAADGNGISAAGALAFDAVYVMESAFKSLMQQKPNAFRHNTRRGEIFNNRQKLTCQMSGEERQVPWEHGSTIAKAIKSVEIEGLTGHIRFNDDGSRVNFTFDVVEMTPENQLTKIGIWSDKSRLQILRNPSYRGPNLPATRVVMNKTYIMTTILEAPYMMMRKQDPNEAQFQGNDRYEGYCKDLASLISQETGINFEIRPVKDGKYGSPEPKAPGGWNGMVGELLRREAEIAIAPLTINSQREQVADFTKPFMSLGISIMIKKPVKQRPGVFSFMNPLSEEIWMAIVFAYIGVSIVLFLVSRFSPCEWKIEETVSGTRIRNHFSITNSLWFALGAFMQQGTDITPRSISGRIVGGAWWFFSLILISSYTANLAAFLTVERMEAPINSADDLAQQTEIEYGALRGGSTLEFFKNSKIPVYERMWEFMSSRPFDVLTNSTQEGIQRVRESKGKYAFLIESTTNEYINERMPCDTMRVGKNLDAKGYGIATAKGTGLHNIINLAVLKLKEKGDLANLKKKWWYDPSECKEIKVEKTRNELLLSNLAGIFFILVAGLGIAMVMALVEFCLKSKIEAKRSKTSLSDAMKAKARLALTGSRDVASVRFYGDSSAL